MTASPPVVAIPLSVVLAVGLLTPGPCLGQVTVVGKMTMERIATPGTTYQDVIAIRNSASDAQRASLTITDYLFDAAGTSQFDPAPSHPRSNGAWITLSQTLVSIPPGETVKVPFTVTVPGNDQPNSLYILGASAPRPGAAPRQESKISGSYWSAIAVEGEGADPVASRTAGGVTLAVKLRYVVQIATHIGNTGEATLAFADPKIESQQLVLEVTDAGTRACRPVLRIEVYTTDGSLVKELTAPRGLLYPTTSIRQVVELPPLSPGIYTVLVYADIGADQVQGQKFQITVR